MSKIKESWFWIGWIACLAYTNLMRDWNGQDKEIRLIQEYWFSTWSWKNIGCYVLCVIGIAFWMRTSAQREKVLADKE